ncbi:MAG: hypothetical protein LUB61_06765 [Eggerthellaceae bacterium]|nr:hypothetical protein [Eggerthellaceae bacterium]
MNTQQIDAQITDDMGQRKKTHALRFLSRIAIIIAGCLLIALVIALVLMAQSLDERLQLSGEEHALDLTQQVAASIGERADELEAAIEAFTVLSADLEDMVPALSA